MATGGDTSSYIKVFCSHPHTVHCLQNTHTVDSESFKALKLFALIASGAGLQRLNSNQLRVQ